MTSSNIDIFVVGAAVDCKASEVPQTIARYAWEAEQSGFDGLWLAEHHFIRYGGCASAMALSSFLLGRTKRLAIGTAACVLSNRHPIALGEEAQLLHDVSGGRFRLGVARGGPWVDVEVFGAGLDRFKRGFAETIDVLRSWFSGLDMVEAHGEFFDFRAVVVPTAGAPAPPMWIAATSPATVEVAARRGIPLLLGVHTDDQEKTDLIGHYRDIAKTYGFDPDTAEHAAVYLAWECDDREQGTAVLAPGLTRWLTSGVGDYVRVDGSRSRRDLAGYARTLLDDGLIGPAPVIAERLRASMTATGITRALLMVEGAGDPALVTANIRRLGDVARHRLFQPEPIAQASASSIV